MHGVDAVHIVGQGLALAENPPFVRVVFFVYEGTPVGIDALIQEHCKQNSKPLPYGVIAFTSVYLGLKRL